MPFLVETSDNTTSYVLLSFEMLSHDTYSPARMKSKATDVYANGSTKASTKDMKSAIKIGFLVILDLNIAMIK